MKKIFFIGALLSLLLGGCKKNDEAELNGDLYFPLQVGNKWEYQIVTKSSEKADVTDNFVLEIISADKSNFTANITTNSGTPQQIVFTKTDSKITVSGKTFLTSNSSSSELANFYRLFYGPNATMFNGKVQFSASGDELKVFFSDSWTNFIADMDLQFEDTYKKGIGLTKSKWSVLTYSAYAVLGTDAYGSLKKAVINGKEYKY